VKLVRQVLAILVFLGLAAGSQVAAAATIGHKLAHAAQPVTGDQHHHHDADGTVDIHGDSHGDRQKNDGPGHTHGLISVDLASIPAQAGDLPVKHGRNLLQPGQAQPLPAIAPPQEKRPPRTA
jgi:hypothetical protein